MLLMLRWHGTESGGPPADVLSFAYRAAVAACEYLLGATTDRFDHDRTTWFDEVLGNTGPEIS